MNFTHFSHKNSHISPSKTVYIYTLAIIIVHIHSVTVAVYTIILLISQFSIFFFSLSLLHVQNELSLKLFLSSSSFSSNTPTQTHSHRDTQTHPHRQTNREREIGVGVSRLWIGESVLVVEIRVCELIEMSLDAVDQCWRQRSVLVGQRKWVFGCVYHFYLFLVYKCINLLESIIIGYISYTDMKYL